MLKHELPITDEEFKKAQENRNTSNQHDYPESPWFAEVYNEFWPYIKSPHIDIGARNGMLVVALNERGIETTGLEITDIADFAIKKGRNVVKGDIQKRTSFADKQFKSASMLHVIEHCYDPEAALEEIKRILDGHIIFIFPGQGRIDYPYAHFSCFSDTDDLADVLIKHGFEIVQKYSKSGAVNVVIAKTP